MGLRCHFFNRAIVVQKLGFVEILLLMLVKVLANAHGQCDSGPLDLFTIHHVHLFGRFELMDMCILVAILLHLSCHIDCKTGISTLFGNGTKKTFVFVSYFVFDDIQVDN